MLYVGLDLSPKRLDLHACRADGEVVAVGAAPSDAEGLAVCRGDWAMAGVRSSL